MQAILHGQVIAESDETIDVEGNQYFPFESVNMDFLIPSSTQTVCPWKGNASYYSVKVGDELIEDAAWTYKEPKEAASQIKEFIAFWKEVKVR